MFKSSFLFIIILERIQRRLEYKKLLRLSSMGGCMYLATPPTEGQADGHNA